MIPVWDFLLAFQMCIQRRVRDFQVGYQGHKTTTHETTTFDNKVKALVFIAKEVADVQPLVGAQEET